MTKDRHSRWIMRNTSDIDETVHLLSVHFKVSKERVLSSYPYRGYGVFLSRKHTACSNAEIARYFGGLTYSGVTKIGTRLRERMRGDEGLRGEMRNLEEKLSRVNGLTPWFLRPWHTLNTHSRIWRSLGGMKWKQGGMGGDYGSNIGSSV